jgi:hypothetical protein
VRRSFDDPYRWLDELHSRSAQMESDAQQARQLLRLVPTKLPSLAAAVGEAAVERASEAVQAQLNQVTPHLASLMSGFNSIDAGGRLLALTTRAAKEIQHASAARFPGKHKLMARAQSARADWERYQAAYARWYSLQQQENEVFAAGTALNAWLSAALKREGDPARRDALWTQFRDNRVTGWQRWLGLTDQLLAAVGDALAALSDIAWDNQAVIDLAAEWRGYGHID